MQLFSLFLPVCVLAICPNGFTNMYNGRCVYFQAGGHPGLSWDDAQKNCQALGGDLASIHNQEEDDMVYAVIPTGNWVWIGLSTDSNMNGTWCDGSPFDFQNFLQVRSSSYDANLRGMYRTNAGIPGKWDWSPSHGYAYSVCTANQEIPSGPCEQNYTYQEELGLCLRVNATETSWNEAEMACQADNAHLVSIHSADTNSFIRRQALSDGFHQSIFIGMSLESSGDGVATPQWSDNTPVDYRNFNQGMPNALLGNCMAMETRSVAGDWISVHCDDETMLPFLCSKPPPCPTTNTFFLEGEVFSPDYPSSPSRAVNCEYFLVGNNGSAVLVQFEEIVLVNDDQILLYDGAESEKPMAVVHAASVGKRYMTERDNVLRLVYQTGTTEGIRKWRVRFGYF